MIRKKSGFLDGLSNSARARYAPVMQTPSTPSAFRPLIGIALAAVMLAVLIAALAGWSMHGTAILFTYAQNGLAWCL